MKQFSVEGQLESRALLFVHQRALSICLKQRRNATTSSCMCVAFFIMNDCDELIPEWWNVVKGVADSEDLPLNISRETLKQNNILRELFRDACRDCREEG